MQNSSKTTDPALHRAGWSIRDWCTSTGISDSLLHKLDPSSRPASVKIGKKRLILEAPEAWLRRVGEADV